MSSTKHFTNITLGIIAIATIFVFLPYHNRNKYLPGETVYQSNNFRPTSQRLFEASYDLKSAQSVDDGGRTPQTKDGIGSSAVRSVSGLAVRYEDVPYYNQGAEPWASIRVGGTKKTVKNIGCGPCTLAMIISALTGDKGVDPESVTAWAVEEGLISAAGGSHSLPMKAAKNWGLKCEKIGANEISMSKALREGKFLVGVIRNGGPLYSGGGHFIGFSGITEEGNFDMLDSGSRKNYESNPHAPTEFIPWLDKSTWYAIWKE